MDIDLKLKYREATNKLPLDTHRRLFAISKALLEEYSGPARCVKLLMLCDKYLTLHKTLPAPNEFAGLRREVLMIRTGAEESLRRHGRPGPRSMPV
jgi:hypothetical protein